jgi:hypothetical protein
MRALEGIEQLIELQFLKKYNQVKLKKSDKILAKINNFLENIVI